MHRCWERAAVACAADRTWSRRRSVGRRGFRQAGSVQEDTPFPIEEVGPREGWIRGADRGRPALCVA